VPIPDYQTFMRPLLQTVEDGDDHRMRDLYPSLATVFQLTEAEMGELLPSGKQATYINRIGWAKTYLVKAGALESRQRATVRITERGRQLLAEHPQAITTRILHAYPEFVQFQTPNSSRPTDPPPATPEELPALSPEEQIDTLFSTLNDALATDLLEQVMILSPQQFERLVVEVLVAMGYGGTVRDAGEALGRTGDNGIDGIIKQDPLGLDKVYLQAKQWSSNVGSQEVRNFSGSLTYHKATKGVLITTAGFSGAARDTARQIGNIILIDGHGLSRLMIEYGVGVATRNTYLVRRVDSEYFDEL